MISNGVKIEDEILLNRLGGLKDEILFGVFKPYKKRMDDDPFIPFKGNRPMDDVVSENELNTIISKDKNLPVARVKKDNDKYKEKKHSN